MKHLLAFIIAPTATTLVAAIACGLIWRTPAAAIFAALLFGYYIILYTILLGVPGHLILWFFRIRSRLAYALYGLVAGSAMVPLLAGVFSRRGSSPEFILLMTILCGCIGMLNATIFAVAFRKLTEADLAGGNATEPAGLGGPGGGPSKMSPCDPQGPAEST